MRTLTLPTVLLLLATLLGAVVSAEECGCLPISSVAEEKKNSSLVFSGTLREKSRFSLPKVSEGYKEFRLTFDVLKYWKGDLKKKITIRTPANKKDCGFDFVKGKSYLIYARGMANPTVNTCSRTILRTERRAFDDMKALGDHQYPEGATTLR